MLIGYITMTSDIECKVINHINILFNSIMQGGEERSILSHMMSATRVDYRFILWILSQQQLRSSNIEGKVIGRSTSWSYNCYIAFKILDLLFQLSYLFPIGIFNMSFLPTSLRNPLLLICPRGEKLLGLKFSFLVETFLLGARNVGMYSILVDMLTLVVEQVTFIWTTKLPFIK